MPSASDITRRFAGVNEAAGGKRTLSGYARGRRWIKILDEFPDISQMRVLDLGGVPAFWTAAPVRPVHVTTVNLSDEVAAPPWITHVVGDACDPPVTDPFDIVVSNSLIEHLGGEARRRAFSAFVREAAPRYWVQTPYRYFPIEPHWLFPGIQFLPSAARVTITTKWPLGHMHTTNIRTATANVLEVELIDKTQLRSYFPDGQIWSERFAGLTKSITALRNV